jgi:methyl-accepting chemotaxis protein
MKKWRNIKIVQGIIFMWVFALLATTGIGIVGYINISKLYTATNEITTGILPNLQDWGDVNGYMGNFRNGVTKIIDRKFDPANEKALQDLNANIHTTMERNMKAAVDQEEVNLVKQALDAYEKYYAFIPDLIEKRKQDIVPDPKITNEAMVKVGNDLTAKITANVEYQKKVANDKALESKKLFQDSIMLFEVIFAISILVLSILSITVISVIRSSIKEFIEKLRQLSEGDLTLKLNTDLTNEFGTMNTALNKTVLSLKTTVSAILTSAESVAAAAQQISASTEEIASGSNNQASAAQTMNELFQELSAAINSVALSAVEAAELSDRTMEIANDGGKVIRSSIIGMNSVNEQMSKLEADSSKIGEIIEVIDDISEQTNLLALNAAIEAARAGEQGRGFAVVADEVRKLAERSGEATKQITEIIKQMQANTKGSVIAVQEGVASSQKTGEAFEEIISMVNSSATKVSEIVAASEEQAAQTSEVQVSIESISAVTQETAASSQETASTAQSLAGLADELHHAVAIFKIK